MYLLPHPLLVQFFIFCGEVVKLIMASLLFLKTENMQKSKTIFYSNKLHQYQEVNDPYVSGATISHHTTASCHFASQRYMIAAFDAF
uniref:Uncharacterized protein n=1 Tax=Arundo donax TaxID=35708 RepID=A0A0A9QPX2_ARUDO